MYGETHQANYLNNAKQRNSDVKSKRALFDNRTNENKGSPLTKNMEAPVSPFKDQSNKISSMRDGGVSSFNQNSPIRSFDYNN